MVVFGRQGREHAESLAGQQTTPKWTNPASVRHAVGDRAKGDAMSNFRRWMVRSLVALMVGIPLMAISLYFINPFGAQSRDPRQRILGYAPYRIPSRSMLPTFEPGTVVLMRAGYYRKHVPARGEVVIFLDPQRREPWVQRVIGLPGERIAIDHGTVRIDGAYLTEDYLDPANVTSDHSRQMHEQKVPADSYFLLGDNRDNSYDARIAGATPRGDLTGKVIAAFK
ncbi:MAG TPA: signal peptidase I [Pseudoxanthomonas sp.]|nr:signal peptidase I [Pseudoxanthomonas sp.]